MLSVDKKENFMRDIDANNNLLFNEVILYYVGNNK